MTSELVAWRCMDCRSHPDTFPGPVLYRIEGSGKSLECPNNPKHHAFENVSDEHKECIILLKHEARL